MKFENWLLPLPKIITPKQYYNFWCKVNRKGDNDCWLWIASTTNNGYGQYNIGNRIYMAHRISYYMHNNMIDPGPVPILHDCDIRKCVNPEHLIPGTHSLNQLDSFFKGRNSHKGELNNKSELREKDIPIIHKLSKIMRVSEIAKLFNVSWGTIDRIIKGEAWTHVK